MILSLEYPSTPRSLTLKRIGVSWVVLAWNPPISLGRPGISKYVVTAIQTGENITLQSSTSNNATRLNFTDLLPSSTYQFNVQAVIEAADAKFTSSTSDSVQATTGKTGNCK